MQLRRDGGPPLFRQIATRLRYEIAQGHLAPGNLLPPLRRAEAQWRVSLHTVRRAYALLEEEGLLETVHGSGTRVSVTPHGSATLEMTTDMDRLVSWAISLARDRFGLSAREFANQILDFDTELPIVWVVECSEVLSEVLARQIRRYWEVDARPWSLGTAGRGPHGAVVSTYYHVGEVRAALESGASPTFLPVELDPEYVDRLKGLTEDAEGDAVLCGVRDETLDAMATDLLRCLPDLRLRRTTRPAARVLAARADGEVVILSPEAWDSLSDSERDRSEALVHLSCFRLDSLSDHAKRAGWRPSADGLNR